VVVQREEPGRVWPALSAMGELLRLEQEAAQPAAANRRAQQRAFDRFVKEFNEVNKPSLLLCFFHHFLIPSSCQPAFAGIE